MHFAVDDLSVLSISLLSKFVSQDMYTFSRHNLLTALNLNSDDRFPVLKKIKESNTAIYKYIIDNIDGYLNFLNDDEW